MEAIASALRDRVSTAGAWLRGLAEPEVARKPDPARWSKKEILGHLIDSACNNHQRFVRAQLEGGGRFPGYDQEGWVRCQGYADADWAGLVAVWEGYNRHLADVLARVTEAAASVHCVIGDGQPLSLAGLAEDYVRHLNHHLAQLARTVATV